MSCTTPQALTGRCTQWQHSWDMNVVIAMTSHVGVVAKTSSSIVCSVHSLQLNSHDHYYSYFMDEHGKFREVFRKEIPQLCQCPTYRSWVEEKRERGGGVKTLTHQLLQHTKQASCVQVKRHSTHARVSWTVLVSSRSLRVGLAPFL